MKWWMQKSDNVVQKILLDIIPIIICWNLWKDICSAKYGAKKSSMIKVNFSINSDINLLLGLTYPNIQWSINLTDLYSTEEMLQYHTFIS